MKNRLLLSVSFTALSASTLAADPLSANGSAYDPPVAAPYSWTGFYAGAQAGYGWGAEQDNQSKLFPPITPVSTPTTTLASTPAPTTTVAAAPTTTTTPVPTTTTTIRMPFDHLHMKGFVGGLHGGYNYQINQFVIGAEGDVDYTTLQAGGIFSYRGGVTGSYWLKSDWQGSVRLRGGYAFNNLLLYGTGGVAFADARLATDGFGPNNTHVGWTAGGGVEYAFTRNWIGRVEARYSDFYDKTYQTQFGPVRAGWTQTVATVGLSYKF